MKPNPRLAPLSDVDLDEVALEPRNDRILSPLTPTIYVHGEITPELARRFQDALETLTYERQVSAALVDIASDGGDFFAMASMLSAMAGSRIAIATFASGQAFSAAAVLLAAGKPGARFMSPFGAAMVHGILTGVAPQGVEDVAGQARFDERLNTTMLTYLAKNCGTTLNRLKAAVADGGGRSLWLMPDEALKLKLIDHIGIPSVTQEISYGVEGLKV